MSERWRKPAQVIDVVVAPDRAQVWMDDDRARLADYEISVDAETTARIREGRICVECLEPFEEAFPVECNVCFFPVRAEQAARFAAVYQGDIHVGSHVSLAEEAERMREHAERRKHTKSGIWLPNNPLGGEG